MKIISGGQTGADQAAWRAARRYRIETGGWMPRGYLTEDGPRPEFADLYNAREHASPQYPPRTKANVRDADAMLWFGDCDSPGGRLSIRAMRDLLAGPWLIIQRDVAKYDWKHSQVAEFIRKNQVGTLLIAGNRESNAPGIGAWVEEYLCKVFQLLGYEESG